MTKILWLTDLHRDEAGAPTWNDLLEGPPFDRIVVTGDIADGVGFAHHLGELRSLVDVPIHFVLGNHDFYGSSIRAGREAARAVEGCFYQTLIPPFSLPGGWVLIGHDGWADGQAGDFFSSKVRLRDYVEIEDLSRITSDERFRRLRALGREAAEDLRQKIAVSEDKNVALITHVPPFEESALYGGNKASPLWAPHFVCSAVGDMLYDAAKKWPKRYIKVLCGHAHHEACVEVLPNLTVHTGRPGRAGLMEFGSDLNGCSEP